MKTNTFIAFVLVIVIGIACISCFSPPPAQPLLPPINTTLLDPNAVYPDIEPESLIGTKWVGADFVTRSREALDFIDDTTCILISRPNQYTVDYRVEGNRIYLGSTGEPYVLAGDILYVKGFPIYQKAQ
jgi:hypothetical protein